GLGGDEGQRDRLLDGEERRRDKGLVRRPAAPLRRSDPGTGCERATRRCAISVTQDAVNALIFRDFFRARMLRHHPTSLAKGGDRGQTTRGETSARAREPVPTQGYRRRRGPPTDPRRPGPRAGATTETLSAAPGPEPVRQRS